MQGEWIGEMPECNPVACGTAPGILNGVKISGLHFIIFEAHTHGMITFIDIF